MAELSSLTGKLPAILANAVSDAIHAALESGMEVDEAVCVVAGVAADYGRASYGNDYLDQIAAVVKMQGEQPLPTDVSKS